MQIVEFMLKGDTWNGRFFRRQLKQQSEGCGHKWGLNSDRLQQLNKPSLLIEIVNLLCVKWLTKINQAWSKNSCRTFSFFFYHCFKWITCFHFNQCLDGEILRGSTHSFSRNLWVLQKLLPFSALILVFHKRAKHLCCGRHVLLCAKIEYPIILCVTASESTCVFKMSKTFSLWYLMQGKPVSFLHLFSFPLPKRYLTC